MKRIGFSHDYHKLHYQTKAQLLQCVRIMRCEIDERAYVYDASYYDENDDLKFFPLEDGDYLRLLLMGDYGIPFTTYRKDTPENRAKYLDSVGNWFEIYVKEDAK